MKVSSLFIGAFALFGSFAHGQTITNTLTGITPYLGVSGNFNGSSEYVDEWSGVLIFNDFNAFCGEPNQPVSLGETLTYTVVDPANVANYDLLARIVTEYHQSSQDALNAAAAQWAIWKIVTDGATSPSFSDGLIRLSPESSEVSTLALNYISQAGNYAAAQITILSNPNRQDMVAFTPVPEPAVAMLSGLGLLFLLRRKR